jgi:hypothetical protein
MCPVLDILKYEHDQSQGEAIFEPGKFASSIEHFRHCLQDLVLYRPEKYYKTTACRRKEVTTISFSEFKKLTSLSITVNLLLGAPKSPKASTIYQISHQWIPPPPEQNLTQCLPKSLEYLCLKECSEWIEEDVSELVEQVSTLSPNLKTLVLTFEKIKRSSIFGNPRGLKINWSAAEKWEEQCTAKGIEFDVLYN